MRIGYGRGYYGGGQLARAPRRKRSWFTIVAVLGVGATAVWLLWPRGSVPDFQSSGVKEPEPPAPPPASTSTAPLIVINTAGAPLAASPPLVATGAFLKQLEDEARARGFASVKDYENSVLATAKQLQTTGAKVVFAAPHLQHLAPQLES
jgi:hypothetical protein